MTKTKIEWADEVWNPVTGCTKVSAGCKNCYAERMAKRLAGRYGYPEAPNQFKVKLHPDKMGEPLYWKKPARIFVDSMGDLFHEDVPFVFILRVWMIMAEAKQHTFIILTKRPEKMNMFINEVLPDHWGWAAIHLNSPDIPLPNVWLGVSLEDQETADERIPWLMKTPAAVRFVSVEPMLGGIDIIKSLGEPDDEDWALINEIQDMNDDIEPEEFIEECEAECDWVNYGDDLVVNPEWQEWSSWRKYRAGINKFHREINWVICGCESGPGARPMELDWARSLRDQCQAAGVPFFFKQAMIDGKLVHMPELDGKVWAEMPFSGG